jgi:hypothetical protein
MEAPLQDPLSLRRQRVFSCPAGGPSGTDVLADLRLDAFPRSRRYLAGMPHQRHEHPVRVCTAAANWGGGLEQAGKTGSAAATSAT